MGTLAALVAAGPIEKEYGLSKEQACVLSSDAVDLVIGQVVDVPNDAGSAIFGLEVFDE